VIAVNNEDKILKMLEQVIDEQKAMRTELSGIQSEQKAMRTEMSDMRTELTRVAMTQENVVLPRLDLLAEGHVTISEQIKSLSVIDELKNDVSVLKLAVRTLTDELAQLKAAM
jgi:uncharacterized protein (DUF3084 family)